MRDWYRINVEESLNQLPINWDIAFTWYWSFVMFITMLVGGY